MTYDIHSIASWTVDPARWQQFVAIEAKLAGAGRPENRIVVERPDAEAVTVTVSWSEVLIGEEDLYPIRPGTVRAVNLIQEEPRCLEIQLVEGGALSCLRFPAPDKSFVEVARVRNHFINDQYQQPRPV